MVVVSATRRTEVVAAATTLGLSAAVVLLLDPAPPLYDVMRSDAWTRVIEFVVIALVMWLALVIMGVIRTRIGIGPNGLTAERLAEIDARSDAAIEEIRAATLRLADNTHLLGRRLQALDEKVDRHLDHRVSVDGSGRRSGSPSTDPRRFAAGAPDESGGARS